MMRQITLVDFNKPIDRKAIDMASYEAKFKLCDDWISGKIKDDNSKFTLKKLLIDKTTFAYLYLKDNEGKRVKLYPWQDLVINDSYDRIYIRGANQIGKDFLLNVDAVQNLLIDHGFAHNEAIVSDSLKQATYQMRRIKAMLYGIKIRWKENQKDEADNMSMISVPVYDNSVTPKRLKYRNTLILAPCSTGLLGYDLHKLILDEFEFWKDVEKGIAYFYNQIADPRTYHTKGKICIISNPNGVESYGNVLETQKLPDGSKRFHTYFFDFLDDPTHNADDLEKAKLGKNRMQIESTLMAIRSISDRNYFTQEEIERSYDASLTELKMVGKQPFFFLDVGAKHDQSVLVGAYFEPYDEGKNNEFYTFVTIIHPYPVGYPLSRVVGSISDKQENDGWHYEKSVKDYLTEWSIEGIMPVFGCDVTGNSGIIPLFETAGIFPEDVTFSGPVKSGMYQRFKELMEKGLLHRIKSEEFEYQTSHLIMKKSIRGYLMVHHENEDDLDDVPDAIAGLINLYNSINAKYAEPSLKIFYKEENKDDRRI